MRTNKPRVEFSEKFTNFAETVIAKFVAAENPKLRIMRQQLNAMATDFGIDIVKNTGKQALREFLTERGYKIHIGAAAVYVSKIPVTNVPEDQWPKLVENLATRLVQIYAEKGEPYLKIWPAQFRNIATVWPADHMAFNQMVIDRMLALGYTLSFHVNSVDMRPVGTKPRKGKRPVDEQRPGPRIRLMTGRSFLPVALSGRRVSWRRGFTHALMLNAVTGENEQSALTTAMLLLPDDRRVLDCNNIDMHALAISCGDVLLANDEALENIKHGHIVDVTNGHRYPLAIQLVSLKD